MHDYLLLLGRVVHSLAAAGELSELRDSKLTVLLTVLSFLNGESLEAKPSVKTIAERSRIPESTVYRVLNELEQGGFLTCENKVYGLGHRLEAAVHAHAQRATNNSSVLEQSSNNSSVELTEVQQRACVRKSTKASDIRQLILRYGSEHLDKAILEMEAQYPSDELIRASFGALVRRACENGWVSEKRDRIEAKQLQACVEHTHEPSSLPSEVTVLMDPDGRKLPIIRRTFDAIVVQIGIDGAGVPKEAVIRPADLTLFSWIAS